MNEREFLSTMTEFAFIKVGQIRLDGGNRPSFDLEITNSLTALQPHGFVYLWVEISEKLLEIVYVGMAGKTVLARCRQHEGGFRRSSTGMAHADRLRDGSRQGKRYEVWARKSGEISLFGVEGLSLASVEEMAFIKKFGRDLGRDQLWNSA